MKMASKIYMFSWPLTMKEKKKTVNLYVIFPGCLTSPFWDTTIFSKWNSSFWYSTQSFQLSKGAKRTKVNNLYCTIFQRGTTDSVTVTAGYPVGGPCHTAVLWLVNRISNMLMLSTTLTNYPLFAMHFLYSVFVIWNSICVFNTKWDIRVHFCDLLVRLFL